MIIYDFDKFHTILIHRCHPFWIGYYSIYLVGFLNFINSNCVIVPINYF